MVIDTSKGFTKIIADGGKKITNKKREFFSDFICVAKNGNIEDYEEVGREIWKHFIEDPNPDVVELQARTKDINDTINIVMAALADSDEQNSSAIDAILLAIDDLYRTLEPIILKGGE